MTSTLPCKEFRLLPGEMLPAALTAVVAERPTDIASMSAAHAGVHMAAVAASRPCCPAPGRADVWRSSGELSMSSRLRALRCCCGCCRPVSSSVGMGGNAPAERSSSSASEPGSDEQNAMLLGRTSERRDSCRRFTDGSDPAGATPALDGSDLETGSPSAKVRLVAVPTTP